MNHPTTTRQGGSRDISGLDTIRLPDDWDARLFDTEHSVFVEFDMPSQGDDVDADEPGEPFPGGVATNMIPDGDTIAPRDVAVHLVAAAGIAGMHEALEQITVNGAKVAAPHPIGEDEMWDWLTAKMVALVDTYVERYPLD